MLRAPSMHPPPPPLPREHRCLCLPVERAQCRFAVRQGQARLPVVSRHGGACARSGASHAGTRRHRHRARGRGGGKSWPRGAAVTFDALVDMGGGCLLVSGPQVSWKEGVWTCGEVGRRRRVCRRRDEGRRDAERGDVRWRRDAGDGTSGSGGMALSSPPLRQDVPLQV